MVGSIPTPGAMIKPMLVLLAVIILSLFPITLTTSETRLYELLDSHKKLQSSYDDLSADLRQSNALTASMLTRDESLYNRDTNNCYQQSLEMAKHLKEKGFYTMVAINPDRSHAWLMVGIEATNGSYKILGTSTEIMELRDHNGNHIWP